AAARASALADALWTAFDQDKNGSVGRTEVKGTFDAWYAAADSAKTGSIAAPQLADAIDAAIAANVPAAAGGGAGAGLDAPCGGRSQQPTIPCANDVQKMLAALPATAPAKSAKPHKVLIFSRIPSAGYQHSSIPIAAKTIE